VKLGQIDEEMGDEMRKRAKSRRRTPVEESDIIHGVRKDRNGPFTGPQWVTWIMLVVTPISILSHSMYYMSLSLSLSPPPPLSTISLLPYLIITSFPIGLPKFHLDQPFRKNQQTFYAWLIHHPDDGGSLHPLDVGLLRD
jgi:hypothetical protein